MKLALALVLAACGGSHPPPGKPDPEPVGVVKDTRTPIEQRRDAACDHLGPKITQCAVEDAGKDLAAGKITKQQYQQDTASGVQRKNTEEFEKKCKVDMSSRQVRVLEVCFKEESECAPLLDCLSHLNEPAK